VELNELKPSAATLFSSGPSRLEMLFDHALLKIETWRSDFVNIGRWSILILIHHAAKPQNGEVRAAIDWPLQQLVMGASGKKIHTLALGLILMTCLQHAAGKDQLCSAIWR